MRPEYVLASVMKQACAGSPFPHHHFKSVSGGTEVTRQILKYSKFAGEIQNLQTYGRSRFGATADMFQIMPGEWAPAHAWCITEPWTYSGRVKKSTTRLHYFCTSVARGEDLANFEFWRNSKCADSKFARIRHIRRQQHQEIM